jgi:nucleoside-diphosphate-sugar epimerase
MKIAITGAGGLIGSYLSRYYPETGHHVTSATRQMLDLTDADSTRNFFSAQRYDVVIHTALHGRNRVRSTTDSQDIYEVNWQMWQNLADNRHRFHKLINIGSGMEYDPDRNIEYADEDDISYVEPVLPYAKVKNQIARAVLEMPDSYTLRLFGVLHYKDTDRFFGKLKANQGIVIEQDRKFDYFNLEDLPAVIDLVLENRIQHRQINCVYENKYMFSELAKMFCDIQGIDFTHVQVAEISHKNYTGSNTRLASYGLPQLGLELAMLRY